MPSTEFEWNEAKNRTNIAKHGLSFQAAALALATLERPRLHFRSVRMGEERDVSIIEINGRLWAVVHIERDGIIRIISARRARKGEERQYGALFPR